MDSEENTLSIVVTGAMNPMIHHIEWYRNREILNNADGDISPENSLCTPPFAQLMLPNYRISCHQERWEIATSQPSMSKRILEIASATFGLLEHTPVGAFGFNFNFHRKTVLKNVDKWLGNIACRLSIPLAPPQTTGASFSFKRIIEKGRVTVVVEPSTKHSNSIQIRNNFHYQIILDQIPEDGIFDLGKLLYDHFDEDLNTANKELDRILQLTTQTKSEEG